MTRLMRTATMAVLAFTLIAVLFQGVILATHSWGGYHWARTYNPFTVSLGDNVSSTWDPILSKAASDWSNPDPPTIKDVLDAFVVAGQATNRNCRPTSGQVEVCNAPYGANGWLGVAQIWISGGVHITQGTVKLNDTYFNTPTYNTYAWRQFVTCQEIGHTFGLAHQDENFNNVNLGSCMDYTSDPDGQVHGWLDNEHPNTHDYDELAIIYSHVDSTTTIKSSPAASGADLDSPSQWGQLMRSTHGGRAQTFERDFGNGQRVVTFVIWA